MIFLQSPDVKIFNWWHLQLIFSNIAQGPFGLIHPRATLRIIEPGLLLRICNCKVQVLQISKLFDYFACWAKLTFVSERVAGLYFDGENSIICRNKVYLYSGQLSRGFSDNLCCGDLSLGAPLVWVRGGRRPVGTTMVDVRVVGTVVVCVQVFRAVVGSVRVVGAVVGRELCGGCRQHCCHREGGRGVLLSGFVILVIIIWQTILHIMIIIIVIMTTCCCCLSPVRSAIVGLGGSGGLGGLIIVWNSS